MLLDGLPAAALARRWSVPRVTLLERCTSSLDVAHEQAAAGEAAGTVVIAAEQTAGRGRDGRVWHSPVGGIWLAMILRPAGAELAATSIRVGLVVALRTAGGHPLTDLGQLLACHVSPPTRERFNDR